PVPGSPAAGPRNALRCWAGWCRVPRGGVLADLEYDVPAKQVAEGRDALAVERGWGGYAEPSEVSSTVSAAAGRLQRSVFARASKQGAEEGHRVGVDSIGVWLHRSWDSGEGPDGPENVSTSVGAASFATAAPRTG